MLVLHVSYDAALASEAPAIGPAMPEQLRLQLLPMSEPHTYPAGCHVDSAAAVLFPLHFLLLLLLQSGAAFPRLLALQC
jgi:hypothetical protein